MDYFLANSLKNVMERHIIQLFQPHLRNNETLLIFGIIFIWVSAIGFAVPSGTKNKTAIISYSCMALEIRL